MPFFFKENGDSIWNKFLENARLAIIANAASNIFAFATVTIAARNMAVDDFAIYASFVSIVLVLSQVMDFGFTVATISNQKKLEKANKLDQAIAAIFLVRIIFGALIALIVILFSEEIEYFLFGEKVGVLNGLIFLFSIGIVNTLALKYQLELRYFNYAKILAGLAAARLFFVILSISIFDSSDLINIFVWSYMLTTIPILLLHLPKLIDIFQYFYSIIGNLSHLLHGWVWPYLSLIFSVLIIRLDTYVILIYQDLETAGRYTANLALVLLIPLVFNALYPLVMSTMNSLYIKHGIPYVLNKFHSICFKLLPIVVVCIFLSSYLPSIFFGEDYVLSSGSFEIMVSGFLIGVYVNLLSTSLYYTGQEKFLSLALLIQLVAHGILSFTYVPIYGILGAVCSAFVARFIGLIVVMFHVKLIMVKK